MIRCKVHDKILVPLKTFMRMPKNLKGMEDLPDKLLCAECEENANNDMNMFFEEMIKCQNTK